MSDFLSRLVQRTRGEATTVRPVAAAVTVPDVGAAAWDEHVIEHESPLAVSPHAASLPLLQRSHAAPAADLASRATGAARIAADREPRSMLEADPAESAAMPASTAHPLRNAAPPLLRLFEGTQLSPAPSPELPSSLTQRDATPRAATHDVRDGSPAVAPALVEVRELHLPVTSRATALAASPTPAPQGVDTSAVLDATTSPSRSTVVTLAASAAPAPSRSERLVATVSHIAPLAAEVPAAHPAESVTTPPASITPTLARSTPRQSLERMPPAQTRERGDSASVHEHSTTVEVSIGRIEVRLPPVRGPVALPTTSPAAPRRTAIGLTEYLQGRDTGKAR